MPSQLAEARPARRRRLPGVNLKQGVVKQARLEAGLSLAQLGKGHVTAPAIYLIETGRTRPSLPTLEHIARRTGKPVEYFLADPGGATDETHAGLLQLESLCAAGRFAEAAAVGRKLLDGGSSAPPKKPLYEVWNWRSTASNNTEFAGFAIFEYQYDRDVTRFTWTWTSTFRTSKRPFPFVSWPESG